jgi:hypothetical protein
MKDSQSPSPSVTFNPKLSNTFCAVDHASSRLHPLFLPHYMKFLLYSVAEPHYFYAAPAPTPTLFPDILPTKVLE